MRRGAFHGQVCLQSGHDGELLVPAETWNVPKKDGHYAFSVYLKASRPGVKCQLRLETRPDVDDGRSPVQKWTREVKLTTQWKRYSLVAEIDRHLKYNRFGRIIGGLFTVGVKPLGGPAFIDALQLEQAAEPTDYAPSTVETRGRLKPWPASDPLHTLCERLQRTPADAPARRQAHEVALAVSAPPVKHAPACPVTGGVLLPRASLFDKDRVRLTGPDGRPVPVQTEALGRYGADASIRSLYVAFLADLPARGAYKLTWNTNRQPAAPSPLKVRETAEQVEVVTGPLRLTLRRQGFTLFDGVWCDANADGRFDKTERVVDGAEQGGLTVQDDAGVVWTSRRDKPLVVVERAGPVEAVVRVQGWHASPAGAGHIAYTVRVFAYAGKPYVKLEHTFTYLGEAQTTQLRSIAMRVPVRGARAVSLGEGRSQKLTGPKQIASDGRQAVSGALGLQAEQGACTVYMPHFQQMHPKAIAADGEGLTVYLWPRDHVRQLCLTRGMARTHDVFLTFGPADRMPSCEPLKVLGAGVRPFAPSPAAAPTGTPALAAAVARKRFPVFSQFIDTHYIRITQAAEAQGVGGLFDFGDAISGGGFWLNNETARPRALFLQYLLTGDRAVHEAAEAAVRHTMDVDTDHKSGGQSVHCIHHSFGKSTGSSHNYANMAPLYYLLSGRRRALSTARENGAFLVKQSKNDRPWFAGRSFGWTLWGLADLCDLTGETRFRDAAQAMARRAAKRVSVKDGKRTSVSGKGGFLYGGTCVNGFMRLHQATGDPMVQHLFLDELNAIMSEADRKGPVTLRGRDCMMFDALAYAYDLTGDVRYVRWGLGALYQPLLYSYRPGFSSVLATELLSRAAKANLPEPVSGGLPAQWSFKRSYTMVAQDADDKPFTVTIYSHAGTKEKENWVKVFAPDNTQVAVKRFTPGKRERAEVRVPADGQRGAYRFEVNQGYPGTIYLAVSLPKVVLKVTPRLYRMAHAPERYYFFVPKGTRRFRVGAAQAFGQGASGLSVRRPDGAVVRNYRWRDRPRAEWQYVTIRPRPEDRAKLWSVDIAVAGQFHVAFEGVPPYVSRTAEAHFVP